MPPRGVKKSTKRARQYEHVKKSEKEAGRSESRAEEIAARAVIVVTQFTSLDGVMEAPGGEPGFKYPTGPSSSIAVTMATSSSSTRRCRLTPC